MTKSEIQEERLKAEGWEYDHSAMQRGYKAAGTVEDMATRKGFDFCRVYTSTCSGKNKYQLTYVYRKEVES